MNLSALLQNATGDVIITIRDTSGQKYVLLYSLAQSPPRLPPSEVVKDRWQNVANLTGNAFGNVDITSCSQNGSTVIEATGQHLCWSRGSVPFVFTRLDDPVAAELVPSAESSH